MSPEEEMATVVDIKGNHVIVVSEKVMRATVNRIIAWIFTVGAVYLVSIVIGWQRMVSNQDRLADGQHLIVGRLDALAVKAPAPADTTRFALQSLEARVRDLQADLQALRRDLRRPR